MSILETVFSSTCFLGESENGLVISYHLDSSPVQKTEDLKRLNCHETAIKKTAHQTNRWQQSLASKLFNCRNPLFPPVKFTQKRLTFTNSTSSSSKNGAKRFTNKYRIGDVFYFFFYGKLLIKNSFTESYLENADPFDSWSLLRISQKKGKIYSWTQETNFGLSSKNAFSGISFYTHRHAETIFQKT